VALRANAPDVRDADRTEFATLFPDVDAARIAFALVTADETGHVAFGPETFDSEMFGLEIGRIRAVQASSVAQYRILFDEVVSRAWATGYDQVLHRTAVANLQEIWALEASGFELMDVGVTFGQRVGPGTHRVGDHSDMRVAPATDNDVETIARIMPQQGWGSRFEAEPAYSAARVREFRTRWLINSYRGRAQAFFVGSLDGEPAGYVTCLLDKAGIGSIELVGTLPAFRGRGVALRVLEHALAWFSERTSLVTVRTQATNIGAAVLYERAGFTLHSSDITFRADLGVRQPGQL
jgi:ribosomal protein S18 acetylase RimI-like enzyme